MARTLLINEGAGFIGSHLADELLSKGYYVRLSDNLIEQIHGQENNLPSYLNKQAKFVLEGPIKETLENCFRLSTRYFILPQWLV